MCERVSYSKLKDTDFFTFFNLSEINRIDQNIPRNSKTILLKPGGFQQFIDISFQISNDQIFKACLSLDRNWIGDEKSINPFAKDITKSFLMALFPEGLNQEFKMMLVQGIWNMKGSQDRIFCIDEVILNWESSNPDIKKFINIFQGIDIHHEIDFKLLSIQMFNEFDKTKNSIWFHLNLSWNDE
ncbi:MAG: hypothetical protein EU535_01030 [Promethearchaeota archaeon]|nr:MAG: hypothetical protein EU535_01030 [Candidatus Lokiarchaeota archaeon]